MAENIISIKLSDDEHTALERLVSNRNTAAKVVWRTEIVLATARGLKTSAIVKETGKDKTTICRLPDSRRHQLPVIAPIPTTDEYPISCHCRMASECTGPSYYRKRSSNPLLL